MQDSIIPPCYYRISIKALILDETGKFLLCKEDNGFYDFPGGGLDYGESPQVGIQRELMEETGLMPINIDYHPSYFLTFTNSKGNPSANIFYKTIVKDLNFIPSNECTEIGFFNIEEIDNIQVFSNVTEFAKIYNPLNHVHL